MQTTHEVIERLLGEDRIGMTQAGHLFGTTQNGRPVHPTTITRWCFRGVKLVDGRRVHLEHFRAGGKVFTSKQAVIRFLAAQTERPADVAPPRTPTQRQRAADVAARELDRLGV